MCGFIGYISNKNSNRINEYQEKFNFFFKKQKYRGPDFNEKILINSGSSQISVGFNRLSIIDQSQDGNKIFRNDEFMLLFNGEILNFLELKKKYFNHISFESKTDTELLFKFLIKFGTSKINELEGMFAFTLINLKLKKLILCRDYTGIKPLYYLKNVDGIFFSSDAWFLYSISGKKLDPFACKFFFQYGFTPKETSLIENVKKVLPSSTIEFDFVKSQLIEKSYFLISKNKINSEIDETTLENKLSEIIKKNLITDTKIGVFLSGGIDSTIIALLAKRYNKNIQAYTSFFTPREKFAKFNIDLNFAERVCKDFDIKLNKVEINEDNKNQKNELINSIKNLDEPISNLNFFNSYLQSQNAKRDDCKVILTGDGADEIFGGYERYKKCYIAKKFSFLGYLIPKIKKLNNVSMQKIPKYFYNYINLEQNNKLFKSIFFNEMEIAKSIDYDLPETTDKNEIINYFDISNWLTEESNSKLDKASMLNSIEARVPFQDKQLIQDYFNIDMKNKIDLFNLKKPLKKLKFLPKYITNRKKRGWFSPESFFLRNYLKKLFIDTFEENKINKQEIFNFTEIMNTYEMHNNGKYHKDKLITILTFQIWYDQVINLD